MRQGVLAFQYLGGETGKGMTARSGLGVYLDLLYAAGLPQAANREIHLRAQQGHDDGQMLVALVLLNIAGGECVRDIDSLEGDAGLALLVRQGERHERGWREQRSWAARFRRARERTLPSESAVFRYLAGFVGGDESERAQGRAFIPAATAGIAGLRRGGESLGGGGWGGGAPGAGRG